MMKKRSRALVTQTTVSLSSRSSETYEISEQTLWTDTRPFSLILFVYAISK